MTRDTPEKKKRRVRRKPTERHQRRLVKAYASHVSGFLYSSAVEADWEIGLRIFPSIHFWCKERADDYGLPLECVCAVVAALSPACPWKKNMADAEAVCHAYTQGRGPETVRCSTYGQNKRKAFRILTDRNPELVKTSQKRARSFPTFTTSTLRRSRLTYTPTRSRARTVTPSARCPTSRPGGTSSSRRLIRGSAAL